MIVRSQEFSIVILFRLLVALIIVATSTLVSLSNPLFAEDGVSKRPNIVWIISEDNSKHYLKHFDESGTPTPAIEAMARHGVTFDRAFSCSPVCSVARTTLITSCYAPRIGTQYHRALKQAEMPANVSMFPKYLKDAGYYTTNNAKEDYNAVKTDGVWNESSRRADWKNRPSNDTPFFHVQTIHTSHESQLHFSEADMQTPNKTSSDEVDLQPYFPDTPLFRYTRARYHDLIQKVDDQVGKLIEDLETSGELENTFVFYFGDHGGVLPRSKGYLFESGLHVPLVVRVGDNVKHLVDRPFGSRTNGFVEFVDFGPTTLTLAGVDVPTEVDGQPFLGDKIDASEVDRRDEAFGHADRFDEKYDLVRSLRVGNWKYIRNFDPIYPDSLQNNYRYNMLAYQQWRQLYQDGELTPDQSAFFESKLPEALYDLETDPHETNNLATEPRYRSQLIEMRDRLTQRLMDMPDLSFIPEAYLIDEAISQPVAFGQTHRDEIGELIRIANLALRPWNEAKPELKAALDSEDPLVRYWAVAAATSFGDQAESIKHEMEERLVDMEPIVVARAVEFFTTTEFDDLKQGAEPLSFLYRSISRATSEAEALPILGTAVFVNDHCDDRFPLDMKQVKLIIPVVPNSELERRMKYLGSL
ncbi:Sulfatase [Rubripirellula amarantea]|uniref:Sulfatase n=1 Tax=Rubripirellula amarantea TaxID=2527999 RepID=A0A5C5WU89_9BACT|nr:sulfatase-like hydrolase/transferase [Rubripirellula amarantea]TWT54287.1 Sulfatase [Rubripirellula amarantea]